MTKESIMIDENICNYYSDTKEDEEGAYPIVGWCSDYNCKCEDIPFDECVVKAVQYCKLKDKQLKRKKKECEKIKNWVKGMMFDTDCSNWFERFTTAFEDWKNDLTSQLDQLKTENGILEKDKAILDAINETLKVQFNKLKAEKDHYKQNLKDIYKLFEEFANEDIITFSDLSPSENYKIILEQFRTVLVKVLNKSGEALND